MSVYIPWTVEAQLSDHVTGRVYIGPLCDCIWAYLELGEEARRDSLIVADKAVPIKGRRTTNILEADEIEWLIDRLGNDVYRPDERTGHWR